MGIDDRFKNLPKENTLNKPESLEQRLRQEFLKQTFLVVEDESFESGPIITALRAERGTTENKEDKGVILVTNYEDCMKILIPLLSENGPENLVFILDIQIPLSSTNQVLRNFGDDILLGIQHKISDIIEKQPNRQINIIFNSSLVRDKEKASRMGGVGFSLAKKEVVSVVKEFLKKKLEKEETR